jgi:hypothetical protein
MARDLARRLLPRPLFLEPLEKRSLLAGVPLEGNLASALVDDAYEENDSFFQAHNLGAINATLAINNLVQADAHDWYRFTLTKTGGAAASVSLSSVHAQGDLDMELYSSMGVRLRVSQGITGNEVISLAGFAPGEYYVHVYGYRGATNPRYSLTINPSSTVVVTDDVYENNDTLATAANLGTVTANATWSNLALLDSADWFRFTTTATGTTANYVSISFQNSQGNLALQLVNSSGSILATANGNGNAETISLANRPAGTYYLRVYSATGAKNPNYSLQINAPAPSVTPTAPSAPPTSITPVASGFDIQIQYTGFTAGQRAIFEQAARRWESIIVGDLPNATYNGITVDDLLIHASAVPIDGVGGTLGQAGYDRVRTTGPRLPYHGSMQFDTADLAAMEANGSLFSVIVHEIGHVLGIGTLWQSQGLLVGAGTSNPMFIGPQAVAAYNAIFGTSVPGVPVENSGGSGTRDAHWREGAFHNEIMTGYINAGANPMSRVTIASLADLGYTVNFAAADLYSPPGGSSRVAAAAASSTSTTTNLAGSGAINPNGNRSPQAGNVVASLALAWFDQLRNQGRPGASQGMLNSRLPAMAAAASQAAWSAAVDVLFAGEADLVRPEVG